MKKFLVECNNELFTIKNNKLKKIQKNPKDSKELEKLYENHGFEDINTLTNFIDEIPGDEFTIKMLKDK